MAKKNETEKKAEALVRGVITKNFKQKIDAETLRAVAEKVASVVAMVRNKKVTA